MTVSRESVKLEGNRGLLRVFDTAEVVAAMAADLFVAEAAKAIADRGRFRVALSGGSTPRRVFELLASQGWRDRITWNSVEFFWGDERYVPPDHSESNYHMTYEALLRKVPISPTNVFRVPTEISPPEAAAAAYEDAIRGCFGDRIGVPQFDLIFLGLGTNGHTASLFPHSPVLRETSRLFVADLVEEVKMWRLTMTVPLLNRGHKVVFLVTGQDKADVFSNVLCDPYTPEILPAQLIQPEEGQLLWFVDQAAAALFLEGLPDESVSG